MQGDIFRIHPSSAISAFRFWRMLLQLRRPNRSPLRATGSNLLGPGRRAGTLAYQRMRVGVGGIARHRSIIVIISTFLLKFVIARTSLEVYRLTRRSIDVLPGITWFQCLMWPRGLPGYTIDRRSPSNHIALTFSGLFRQINRSMDLFLLPAFPISSPSGSFVL